MTANAKAYLAVNLEATGGGEKAEGRGPQGVCGGKGDAAVIYPSGEGRGRGRASDGEVPFKKRSVAQRLCVDVGGGVAVEFRGFAH